MLTKETRTVHLSFDPNEGFLRVVSKAVNEMHLADVKRDMEEASQLVNYEKTPVLADSREYTNYSKEINDYYASSELSSKISAMAILITSLPTRIIGNFFIKMHRPHFPTRLFTNDKDASVWLSKFIEKN